MICAVSGSSMVCFVYWNLADLYRVCSCFLAMYEFYFRSGLKFIRRADMSPLFINEPFSIDWGSCEVEKFRLGCFVCGL